MTLALVCSMPLSSCSSSCRTAHRSRTISKLRRGRWLCRHLPHAALGLSIDHAPGSHPYVCSMILICIKQGSTVTKHLISSPKNSDQHSGPKQEVCDTSSRSEAGATWRWQRQANRPQHSKRTKETQPTVTLPTLNLPVGAATASSSVSAGVRRPGIPGESGASSGGGV